MYKNLNKKFPLAIANGLLTVSEKQARIGDVIYHGDDIEQDKDLIRYGHQDFCRHCALFEGVLSSGDDIIEWFVETYELCIARDIIEITEIPPLTGVAPLHLFTVEFLGVEYKYMILSTGDAAWKDSSCNKLLTFPKWRFGMKVAPKHFMQVERRLRLAAAMSALPKPIMWEIIDNFNEENDVRVPQFCTGQWIERTLLKGNMG
jgi:hypothetical protein